MISSNNIVIGEDNIKREFSFIIIAIIFISGCLGESPQVTTTPLSTSEIGGYVNPDAAIDAAWLTANLDDASLKIIAVPATQDSYEEGHISGALYVDYRKDIVDLSAPVENQMASMEKIQELLQNLGIANEDTIVIYDNTNNMIAARMFNVLKFYGHNDVRLLNGGKNSWTASGGGLSVDVPGNTASIYSPKEKNSRGYVDLVYVYNNMDNPDVIMLDARPTAQYTGEDIRPGIGRGGGHIPGAINVPGGATWNEYKTFKSYEELKEIYEGVGVTKDKKIVAYCHNGMLSSYTWYVLTQLLGYPDVAIYDGSSLEWSNDPDAPLVKGLEPGMVPQDLTPK